MKKIYHLISALMTAAAVLPATSQATDVPLTITGRVVARPCTVSTTSATIDLAEPDLSKSYESGSDILSGWGETTLYLTRCPPETSVVMATFTGPAEGDFFRNVGTAKGVVVELQSSASQILKNNSSFNFKIMPDRNASYTLRARIRKSGDIASGSIAAIISITYTYL